MERTQLNEILAQHKLWLDSAGDKGKRADLQRAYLRGADLQGADLQRAYLQRAYLQRAYLQGADLDFSCWPLWCGSKQVKVDIKLIYQLLAHVYVLDCNDKEFNLIKKSIKKYAVKSHRAIDLGIKPNSKEA